MNAAKLYETSNKPVISFEFFPPRDEKAEITFNKTIDGLAELEPDYMSVTFGAGGSTRDGSYQTVKNLLEKKLPVVAYIAGYGLGPDEITEALDKYRDLGVETIFVIRGDEPKNEDFTPHPDSFPYASDLIEFINKRNDFTLGCAGYPEGHIQAKSLEEDIEYLKLKIQNGAKYIVAQYFYDNELFFKFVEKCKAAGISAPIIPGIMPVYTVKLTSILSRVCGSSLPDEMQNRLDKLADADKDEVLNYGIDFAFEQCKGLLESGVDGLHFYTMDRGKSTTAIMNRLRQENLLD